MKPSDAELLSRAAKIRVVVSDIDGVWTDGGMYYSEHGDELKKFNTRDGMGAELLRQAGIPLVMLTTEETEIVAWRARKLKLEDSLYQGVRNKAAKIREIAERYDVELEEIAYIADDINDLEAMRSCGFRATVADGLKSLKEIAHYICNARGGEGALRELVELIVESRAESAQCSQFVPFPAEPSHKLE
jgi:YrbI family 3-deoxy-D-manno-octulosonate 8-phosphate phosphatase